MRNSVFATKTDYKGVFQFNHTFSHHHITLNRNDTKVYGKSEFSSDY